MCRESSEVSAKGAPPESEAELFARAEALAGRRLGDLARALEVPVPLELRRAKGWVGGLLERALGADAASRAEPDFTRLGVELKTIPVSRAGRPLESTFVCSIELPELADSEWSRSRVRRKLARVLWVPVEGLRPLPPADRRLGSPVLWSPTEQDEELLRADWERLATLVAHGRTGELTGHLGVVLQVRPKAARGASRRLARDFEGAVYDEQPRGFYLRPSFTAKLLGRELAAR
jgi:DNA mismatch repair protein MutH